MERAFHSLFIVDYFQYICLLIAYFSDRHDWQLVKKFPALEPYIGYQFMIEHLHNRGLNYLFIGVYAHAILRMPLEPGKTLAEICSFIYLRLISTVFITRDLLIKYVTLQDYKYWVTPPLTFLLTCLNPHHVELPGL